MDIPLINQLNDCQPNPLKIESSSSSSSFQVDTSSIIENKKSIKEYWEKRMMAEMNGESPNVDQLLIDTSTELTKMTLNGSTTNNICSLNGADLVKRLTSNPVSPSIQKLTSSSQASPNGQTVKSPIANEQSLVKSNGQYHHTSKLGSDGESGEPSPDCSLSPVEVDSLEGGSSRDSSTCDRPSSPDYVNCTHEVDVSVVGEDEDDLVDTTEDDDGFRDCESSPDVGISGCRPDNESSSMSPEIMIPVAATTTTIATLTSNNNNLSNHRRNPSLLSSPVIGDNPNSSASLSPVPPSSSPSSPSTPPSSFPKTSSTPKPSSSETDPQLTLVTEESDNVTEPDSLEEFIKHETECAESNSLIGINQIKSTSDEGLIDSLGDDSGSCQIFSTSTSSPTSPTSSIVNTPGDLLLSPTTSDYKLVDSGVNLSTDDLLLIVDCNNSSSSDSKENLMTNLNSSSSSHNNNTAVAIKNKSSPCKRKDDDNFYDNHGGEQHAADNDSVDNINDVHNQIQNGVGIIENSGVNVASSQLKGLSGNNTIGDGIVRPTIIGQLAKPSDEDPIRSPMIINVSESNIIEVKSSSSSSSSPRDSKLSVINEPASMLVNYDENEHLSHNSSPLVPDDNMLTNNNNKKQSLHMTSSSPISDTIKSPSPTRPLAGIVGKQTGKIVKRESSLPVLSSSTTSSGSIKSNAESMIAEEIRQLKEREEELARVRAAMSKHQGSTLTSSTTSLHNPYPHQQHFNGANHQHQHHPHHLGKSTPSHCSSIDGKSSPALSDLSSCSVGTISNDSIDPVPSKPISLEILSGKVSGLIGESPIEREIRIAREREAELKAQVQLTRCLSNSIVSTTTNDCQLQLPSTATTAVTKGCNVDFIINNNNNNNTNGTGGGGNDNGSMIKGKSSTFTTTNDETIVTSTGTKLPVFKQNSCGAANAADIQKLLATTRIQQEIEEQTQRELALKATGSIKTISQERTDLKVTKLTDIDKAGSTYSSITQINAICPPSVTTTLSSSTTLTNNNNSKATVNIEPQTAKNIEISSGGYNTNGLTGNNQHGSNGLISSLVTTSNQHQQPNHSNHVNSNNVYTSNHDNHVNIIQTNNINNKPITSSTCLTSIPPSSTVSSSSLSSSSSSSSSSTITTTPTSATITTIKRTGFQPFMKKGLTKSISMHKFISSKGKTATPTGNPTCSPFYPLASPTDLYGGDLRPPIMVKGDKGFRRGSVSAESKIQEELKEMKAREEELRRQRARLMGLSQPNLNLIGRDAGDGDGDDDDNDNNDVDHHHGNGDYHDVNNGDSGSAGRNGSLYEIDAGLKRTISNPNIISYDDDKKVCQQFGNSLKPRKNPLIAQWEKKIIKDNPEPRF